jgi:beta-glucanase (GH16 family)
MSRRSLSIVVAVAVAVAVAAGWYLYPGGDRRQPQKGGWQLVFADEFDGTGVDRTTWTVRDREGRDVDLGCNVDSPRNLFQRNGHLTLRALAESTPCGGAGIRPYSEAYLDTAATRSFTYGRFEVRARAPRGSTGLWPAFWLRPDDGGHGEIDVVELPGGTAWQDRATQAIFRDYTPVKQDHRAALPGGAVPGDGFHTYTTEWDADRLRWFIDGVLVWQRDPGTTPWFDEVFHKPYHLRLNLQVGGWPGTPDASTVFPADFVVDHVRVWQRER